MFAPPASASSASAQMRSTASSSPAGPSSTGQVVSIVCARKTLRVDLAQPLELVVAQDRVRDHELACMLRCLVQQVALRADARFDAHHDGLADRVDRRVRHLGEELLEVRVEHRPPLGEDRQRQVVAHRPDRLLRVPRERSEDHLHVVLRVAEGELTLAQRLGRRARRHGRAGRSSSLTTSLRYHSGVRPPRRNGALHFLVRNDPAVLDVDEEQLPGLQPPLPHDVLAAAPRGRRSRTRG